MASLIDIEGIGPSLAEKLEGAGIGNTEELLETCRDRPGRARIASETGIDEKRLLRLVNHADLMRINGIGGEFAELLEASGVDSVLELAQRNADNLAAKMKEVNGERKLVRRVPASKQIAGWIEQAEGMGATVTH